MMRIDKTIVQISYIKNGGKLPAYLIRGTDQLLKFPNGRCAYYRCKQANVTIYADRIALKTTWKFVREFTQ